MTSLSRATEGRIDIRIPCPEPVAERRPQQLACGRRRGAFHDEMLAIEEVGGVFRVRRLRAKPWKRTERRARPFPAVAHQVLDSPMAGTLWMGAGRLRIPAREVEHAVDRGRRGIAPRVPTLAGRRPERRPLEFRFAWQP